MGSNSRPGMFCGLLNVGPTLDIPEKKMLEVQSTLQTSPSSGFLWGGPVLEHHCFTHLQAYQIYGLKDFHVSSILPGAGDTEVDVVYMVSILKANERSKQAIIEVMGKQRMLYRVWVNP